LHDINGFQKFRPLSESGVDFLILEDCSSAFGRACHSASLIRLTLVARAAINGRR
jgi:hypothetical protein